MSDESMTPAVETPAATPSPAQDATPSAAAIAAVRALDEGVSRLGKQVKALWVAVAVIGVIVVVLAAFTLLPRVFGVRLMGGAFPGGAGGFRPDTNQQSPRAPRSP